MAGDVPQGTVTILFVDVVDSTALTESMGDSAFRAAERELDTAMRGAIGEAGGAVVEGKVLGDGVMARFASAASAITAARRCVELSAAAGLQIHAGIHAGDVIHEGGNVYGGAVNIASRVCGASAPGEVLVTATIRELARTSAGVTFEDRGDHAFKGIDDALRLYRVRAESGSGLSGGPDGRAWRFVGRAAELARIGEALARVRASRGRCMLISGEAGVGKTRLAEEGAADARRRGFMTLRGRCYDDAGSPPFGPFVEMLEAAASLITPGTSRIDAEDVALLAQIAPSVGQLFPDVRLASSRPALAGVFSSGDTGLAKQAMFTAVRAFIADAARAQPLLLLLDDVQWADTASLQLLRFLARSVGEMPVAIIATYRDGPLDPLSSLAHALNELHEKHLVTEVELQPFEENEVETLLRAMSGRPAPAGFVRLLYDETSGNAFFIEELYRHLSEEGAIFDENGDWRALRRLDGRPLPKGLRLVIEQRLERLSAATRRVIDAAAVLGTAFDRETIAAMVGAGAVVDCLDEAERSRVIVADEAGDERFRFVHPLMRSAIVAALSSSQRRRLHGEAAKAIEQRAVHSPAVDAEVAHHYDEAGSLADPGRAVAAMRRAAQGALAAYANMEAATRLDAAIALAERISGLPAGDLADMVHLRGQAEYRLGQWERSGASLDRALALYREAGDTAGQAHVLYSKSSLATFEARPSEALSFLAEARELAPADDVLCGLILQLESQNLVDLRRYGEAREVVAEALEASARLGDPYIMTRARLASGYLALATLDMTQAAADFASVSESGVASAHERMGAESRRAIALACGGQLDEAARRGADARAYFRSMQGMDGGAKGADDERDPYELGLSCISGGAVLISRGQLREARSLLIDAIDACGDPPNVRVVQMLTPMLAQVLHRLGEYGEAEACLDRMAPGRSGVFRRMYATLRDAGGDRAATAGEAAAPPQARSQDLRSLGIATLAAEAMMAGRDSEGAREQMGALEDLDARGVVFTSGWVSLVPRVLGAIYLLTGDQLRAGPMLERAIGIARASGADAEVALTRIELAELHAERGDRGAGRRELAEACSLLDGLGMRSEDARVEALTLRMAEPEDTRTLSETQTAMLRLLASGLSNRDIAAQRSLTERAVQRELTALYSKLGVAGRVGAIAYAYKSGVVGDA